MISGVASRFMLDKLRVVQFVRQRSWRLMIPLVFGMLVIVPPQSYFQVIEKIAYTGSYLEFMQLYVSGYHGFCRAKDCLRLPTWNHPWFLTYLWCYSLVLAGMLLIFRAQFDAAAQKMANLFQGWKLMILPVVLLAVLRITLAARFPTTHALVDDWYSHANYFTLFLLGTLLAQHAKFWQEVDRQRWISLALAMQCWALIVIYMAWPDNAVTQEQLNYWQPLMRVVYICCEWTAIIAVCGFAHRHLQFDDPARRYLTQAVFPLYILHQTLIVVVAHVLKPALIWVPLEAVVVIIITFTLSFAIFEIVRRVPLFQPLFGVGRLDTKPSLQAVTAGNGAGAH